MRTEPAPERPSPDTAPMRDLVALSRRFGEDPEFARGGGGNISVKIEGILYIKPSGSSLAQLTAESTIALDIKTLMELLDGSAAGPAVGGTDEIMQVALSARVGARDARRPSVEFLFHALMPERIVLHTHPTTVNAITCSTHGAEITEKLFGSSVLWIPYINPGLPLARAIRDARRSYEQRVQAAAPRIMFLQNHGLIVAADTAAEIEAMSAQLVATIKAHLSSLPEMSWGEVERLETGDARAALRAVGPALRALLATGDRLRVVTFDDSPLAVSLAGSALGRELALVGPLTPDQIVYAGSFPLVAEAPKGATPDQLVDGLSRAIADRAATEAGAPAVS